MNWDDLRFFLALSRAGTLSAAGKALEVKHSTISRRIKAFEDSLGTRLFDRLAEGYVMTQTGEDLYQHALIMEEQAQAVDRKVFGLDAQLQGSINLTVPHDVLSRLVVPHLGLFKRIYPAVDLQLMSTASLVDMAARQADIALRLTDRPADYLMGKKVLPLRHGIYASVDYLQQANKTPQVILWNSETVMPEWVKQHFPNAVTIMRADDTATMLTCANNHMGLVRIPCFVGDGVEGLRRLDLPLAPSSWGLWVLSHVDLRSTARVRACREFLVDILEQQRGLIEGLDSSYWSP